MWLRSPWCNSNKNLISLFEKIKKHYPNFDHPKLTKEKLFKQILPNGKYSDRRMNNLLSEGYLAAERFIIFQNLNRDQNLQRDLLTKDLQNRHLEDWFFKDINKEIARIEKKEIKEWEDHLQLFQLNRRIYHHPNQNPRMQPGGKTIIKMGEQMDLVYLLEKATILNEKIFRTRILKNENHDVSDEIKKWRVASVRISHPSIELYNMRFQYNEENMEKQYFILRETFLKIHEKLNLKEQKIHLQSLINDTVLLIKAGILDITENLPLYKLGLKTGILLQNGKIISQHFVMLVMASNYKGDFDYTKNFIDTYISKLEEQAKLDALFWAKAHMTYYKKEYIQCLDFLLQHDFKIKYFQLLSKLLTTQAYFDLHLKDDTYQSYLFNYFDSFEKWITREKFRSEFLKKSYLRFVQISRSLAKHHSNVNFRKDKIEDLLSDEKNVQAYKWLIQKKDEIIMLKK